MRNAVVTAVACFISMGVALANPAEASAKKHTDIPEQNLGDALRALARDRGIQLVYLSDSVERLHTPGAVGELTVEEALSKLLSGSGLEYKYVDDLTVSIMPAGGGARESSEMRDAGKASMNEEAPPQEPARDSLVDRLRLSQAERPASAVTSAADSASEGSTAESPSVVEEIVVSAQKKFERLQDVPVPVSVINPDALAENSQVLLKDYYARVPGLSMAPNYLGEQRLSIRGVTTGGSNPTVGITIDDVPYGMSIDGAGGNVVPDIDPGDLARVEVLRGPQGTLYGANSMGGLLKFVTVDPSMDGFSGRVSGGTSSVRNGDELGYNVRASANIPLSDTWAMRASGFTRQDPGYIDNPISGENGVNKSTAHGAQLLALWRPSDNTSLKLSALYQRFDSDGVSEIEVEPGLGDLQQSYMPGTGGLERTVQAYSATLKAKLGAVDFTSISGYNVNDLSMVFDRTFQFGSFAQRAYGVAGATYGIERPMKKVSQEFRLSSPTDQRLEWLLGAFYTREDGPYIVDSPAVDLATLQEVGPILQFNQKRIFDEKAAFVGLTWHFTDRFDVQLGGRESWSRLIVPRYAFVGPYTTFANLGPSPYFYERGEAQANTFTYLVTPRFKINDDLMVYSRLASGYRPGAPNSVLAPGVPAAFEPDSTQNYEIGVKADFLQHTLSLDASVYYIDWTDLQLNVRDPVSGIGFTTNGSAAKSEGVELSVTSRPLNGLTINAWVAYNIAELTENFPTTSQVRGVQGDRLPASPEKSGHIAIDQEFPLWGGRVTGILGGEVTYVGDRVGVFQSTALRQDLPSYTQTDLRASLRYDSWTANLFVNNVSDERGLVNGGRGYLPTNAFIYIQPRTVGLNLAKSF
jgi:outer membrane receptor protein involved in Fe transport